MGKINLSVIILTKNEKGNIKKTIESVSFADEILIIDDYSDDDTIPIVKALSLKNIIIYQRKSEGDFSAQRNFGLRKARGEWVLFIDADEIVTPGLKEEIKEKIFSRQYRGFFIPRVDFLWGKKLMHGELLGFKLLRLAQKEAGEWKGKVHEEWEIRGEVGMLTHEIQHFPHQTLREFLSEINYYSTLRAEELLSQKKRVSAFHIVFYPSAKFIVNYFLKRGLVDGVEGFVFACMMSFHSFLVRAKAWSGNSKNT